NGNETSDTGNVAIAFHSIIEDATGTGQADVLIGNDWGNTLTGGLSADFLFGDGSLYDHQHEDATVDQNDLSDPNRTKPASDNDMLIGGSGNDIMMAGNGVNQMVFGGDVIANPQTGAITGGTDDGNDTYIIAMGSGDHATAQVGLPGKTANVWDSGG